ncbi:MAG: caspase family protein [Bacteroidota bacterium]
MSNAQIQLPFTKSYAFIIGINAYQNGISQLKTAVKDAEDMAELFGETHGYEVHALFDATRTQMMDLFEQMKILVKANDRVIFYFAGHGIALDSEEDPEGYLVPADANQGNPETLIPMDHLHNILNELDCKHGLLVLDCCFAGAFKWSTGFRDIVFDFAETLYEERFYRFVEHNAWQVITSTAHDQKAVDIIDNQTLGMRESGREEEGWNSPFAWALKKAINLEGQADIARGNRGDGVITASELYLYLREIVGDATKKQNGKRQVPAIFNLSKHDKGEFIFFHPGHPLNLSKAPELNPYKGLDTYEGEDASTFFGREEDILKMATKLSHSPILVVSAPSGQGKSSTVKAGLLPYLKKEHDYQQVHILRPGVRPNIALQQIPDLDGEEAEILMIDQYEEFFTEGTSRSSQKWFETRLHDYLLLAQNSQLKLIITIRSDFEWQLKRSEFGQVCWGTYKSASFLYRLPPMGLDDMRRAIVKPAWTVAYEFESEEMVDDILEDINYAPGALPLLSFAMHKLFELRDKEKRLLTMDAYENQLGGIHGALSKHADQVYDQLPDAAHQDFMRKLLLRMVQLNDGSYSRRKIYLKIPTNNANKPFLDELNYPDHLDDTKDAVIEILIDAQLLRPGKDKLGPFIEPIHDSLINFWPRCLNWIQDFKRETLVLQRQIWEAVVDYHQWEADESQEIGEEKEPPLWDNNPKLQQIQVDITDPGEQWLCSKKSGKSSLSTLAFLLWERDPAPPQLEETLPWNWYFQIEDHRVRYEKIYGQMDHWLNEEELAFVKESFREEQSDLERIKVERNAAIKAKELAEERQKEVEELAARMALQIQAIKEQFQYATRRDLTLIQEGRKPNLHLLIVAIDDYPVFSKNLHVCVADATKIASTFEEQEGKLYHKVHLHLLTNTRASRRNIMIELHNIQQQASQFDFVMILMSGIGYAGSSLSGTNLDPEAEGAFVTYNDVLEPRLGEIVPLEEIRGPEFFQTLLAFEQKVILLLDFKGGQEFLRPLVEANQSERVEELSHQIFGLTGTSLGEEPNLIPTEEGMRGAFVTAITRCIYSEEGDVDDNEMIYLDELFRYILTDVAQRTGNANQVFAVVPAAMSNIPLIQLGDTFHFPANEVVMSGHIEEDAVIESILATFLDLVPTEEAKVFRQSAPEDIIARFIDGPKPFFD